MTRWLLLALAAAGCTDNSPADGGARDAGAVVDGAASADGAVVPDAAVAPADLAAPPADAAVSSPDLAYAWGGQDITLMGAAVGLDDALVDVSADEAQDLWAVSSTALYVRRPGDAKFRRYTNSDGLHISSAVTAVAGGGPDEGWIGLEGYIDNDTSDDSLDQKRLGKAEHVTLHPDGIITSLHYADMHNDVSANYYETRSARRLLYSHAGPSAGHLFLGSNHGVSHIFKDGWGDHVHVDVRWMPENAQRLGQYFGLAIDPTTGGLWTCGRVGCGLANWNADPRAWVNAKYKYAFTVFTGDHGLKVPHGYEESFVGAAATPDGVAWFLSSTMGLASWDPASHSFSSITRHSVPGLGTPVDIAADPDGTLWIADGKQVLRYDPKTGGVTALAVPAGGIRRVVVDATVQPRALLIATASGLAIYRGP